MLPGGDGAEGDEEWRPQNITKRFYGPTPMREGLVRSRNLVSIRLLRGTGIGYAMKHIAGFGFGPEALPANLTLALGTGQVTPLDMARGFAVFANGGFRVTPVLHPSRYSDTDGKAMFDAAPLLAVPGRARAGGECRRCASATTRRPRRRDDAGPGLDPVPTGARRRRSARPMPS